MTSTEGIKKIHHGRNIKRFREMFGLKQEALAIELGDDWSQKKISRLEESEEVEDNILDKIATVLKVPKEAIKSFTEEAAITFFNTFNDNSISHVVANYGTFNLNSSEELNGLIESNKKLYEQLLAAEKDKIALLEKLLDQKK